MMIDNNFLFFFPKDRFVSLFFFPLFLSSIFKRFTVMIENNFLFCTIITIDLDFFLPTFD